jgi:2-polyprenyl-6-methoxyphenol hydroxylase-like FAD-dependent oxidoreductase
VTAAATWREPARDVPVAGRPDVLVVGAGSAGIAAAVAAARRGAHTWLVEASGCFGGLATAGLINLLLTLDDGAGTQVVAGLCQETVDRMEAMGGAAYPQREEWNDDDPARVEHWRHWGLIWGAPPEAIRYSVAFDPEVFVDASIDMLRAADVRVRLHTWCAGVARTGGRVDAVLVESKRGREAVVPRVVVDATGDGDVALAAGAELEHVTIPPHLWFRAGGVDTERRASGGIWFRTTAPGRALVPFGPAPERVDACDPDDVTRALLDLRAAARAELERLRRDEPAFAGAWLDDYARFLGVTESRRLVGDYVLAKEDGGVRHLDAVARTGHWTRREVVFDVPYRCLTSPRLDNVLVAGRCISTTRYVHQATKEIPAAMATGEAAGAAAAAAAARGVAVRSVDVAALRADLRAQGAIVGG